MSAVTCALVVLAGLVVVGCGDGGGGTTEPPPPSAVLSVDDPGFGSVGNVLVTDQRASGPDGTRYQAWVGFSRWDAWRDLVADLSAQPTAEPLWIAGRIVRSADAPLGFFLDPATTESARGVGEGVQTTLRALRFDGDRDGIVRAVLARIEATSPTENPPLCGNQSIDPGETCEPPFFCHGGCNSEIGGCVDFFCNADCTCPARFCGDFQLESGEECDPPHTRCDGDGSCGDDCRCAAPRCGDRVVNAGEECDGVGNFFRTSPCADGRRCLADCRCPTAPSCGDGVVDPGEECDPFGCPLGEVCEGCRCRAPVCGDGIVEFPERCEPAGAPGVVTCGLCGPAGTPCDVFACREDCRCATSCGDGYVGNDEECDDGNRRDGDGCTSACRIECGAELCRAGTDCCSYTLGPCVPRGRPCPG